MSRARELIEQAVGETLSKGEAGPPSPAMVRTSLDRAIHKVYSRHGYPTSMVNREVRDLSHKLSLAVSNSMFPGFGGR